METSQRTENIIFGSLSFCPSCPSAFPKIMKAWGIFMWQGISLGSAQNTFTFCVSVDHDTVRVELTKSV